MTIARDVAQHLDTRFELRVASSVVEVDAADWDRLAAGRPFASYRWYQFGETVLPDDTPFYVLLYHEGTPIARATFWLTHQEPIPVPSRLARGMLQAAMRHWPLLLCRAPFASSTGLILPDDPGQRDDALRAIAGAALALGQEHHASFVVFDYLDRPVEDVAWPDDFTRVDSLDPGTRLVLRWPDFESYVSDQKKSMRKDYRRHRNRARDLGIEITYHDEVTEPAKALDLVRNVEEHHGTTPNPYAPHILRHAGQVESTWITAEIDGELVGCGLLLGDGAVSFLALLGLDYDVRYAYFQLVYAAIRRAIESGTEVLRGGGGAYELKQRLGFEVEEGNHLVFSVKNPALRWLANRFSS